MKNYIIALLFLSTYISADVLMVDNSAIHYSVPEGLLKKPSIKDDHLVYFDESKRTRLIVQLFRKQQWSDWHMRGLIKSKETFQKFFDTELGGSSGEKLLKLVYDEKKYQLTLLWAQEDGGQLASRMQLTAFGCVAVHVPYSSGKEKVAMALLDKVIMSLKIPSDLRFVPKTMISDLSSNIGGGFFFITISLVYLMFSLFKRSQLHQMKLDRRMKEIKAAKLR